MTRVTPTRRLAHELRTRHDEDCLARGLGAWPTPDIVTWDELIERAFARDRQAGRSDGRWLPASAAQLLWQRMVRDDADLDPLLSAAGVGRAAWQAWNRLHDYRIPLAALDGEDGVETAAFARWCRQYLHLLQSRGWVDGVLAPSRVTATAIGPALELVGFDRPTPMQESVLERWAASGEVEIRRSVRAGPPGAAARVDCLDRAAELDAAARWAAAWLDARPGQRLAIVVPELARHRAQARRILERVLAPATGLVGGPLPESAAFELAAARPLLEQPVVAAALDLLACFVRSPDLQDISRLLRNPFVAGALTEADARARLDARLRRFEGPGFGLAALQRVAAEQGCPRLAEVLAVARSRVSNWREKDYPSDWSSNVFYLLDGLGWASAELGSTEHQAQQRWRALVSEFGACDEFAGRIGRGEMLGQLRDMAGGTLFEPQELRAPLLVIDPETCAGMRFDALWVCGLDAGRWPPPATPDPFLPRELQLRHGVPRASAELAAAEARFTLERLCNSAPVVLLSVPASEDDTPLLPTPLLDGIATAALPDTWSEPRLAVAQQAARPVLEVLADATMPPPGPEETSRGGARLLELQAACPFRAQAELRLGARALEEPSAGVDAAERGDLVHRALAALWLELRTQDVLLALSEDAAREAVARAVATALEEARRSADELMRQLLELESQWLEARVLEMLAADRARSPFTVLHVEEPCTARIGPLTLEMRPDRVDRLADGSLAVIDYKTGASAEVKAWLDERPRLPQLPAYVQALGAANVGAVAFARLRSADTGYAGVARDEAAFPALRVPGSRGLLKDYGTWDELLGAWQRRLEALAAEYAAGDARLAPVPSRACQYCHLGTLCRIADSGAGRLEEEPADE